MYLQLDRIMSFRWIVGKRTALIACINFLLLGGISVPVRGFVQETDAYFQVSATAYTLRISKNSGMITSLRMAASDFELVSDAPGYSLFFPEFVYEAADGLSGRMYYPPQHSPGIDLRLVYHDQETAIFRVAWETGLIDSYWNYIFFRDLPSFQAGITRVVKTSGVYSNAQQCVMYSSEMDESYLVNYEGEVCRTMGGNPVYPYCGGDFPCTSEHNLWTVFQTGNPELYPAFAWYDQEEDITVGVLCYTASGNQIGTMSYHGGCASHRHPGWAEGQWNWFGKSDSESLYLRSGLEYSMALIYYQSFGPVTDFFDFNAGLLDQHVSRERPLDTYSIASWGGRTSTHASYFWRYPQASSNRITSQELFRHKAFSLPASQNGTRDSHLFSLDILNTRNDGNTFTLTPIEGTTPLFRDLGVTLSDTFSRGYMSWNVEDLVTRLWYTINQAGNRVLVSGRVEGRREGDSLTVLLEASARVDSIRLRGDGTIRFSASDPLLDRIAIDILPMTGILEPFLVTTAVHLPVGQDSFAIRLNPRSGSFTAPEGGFTSYRQPYIAPLMDTAAGFSILPLTAGVLVSAELLDDSMGTLLLALADAQPEIFLWMAEFPLEKVWVDNRIITFHKEDLAGYYRLDGPFTKGMTRIILSGRRDFLPDTPLCYPNPARSLLTIFLPGTGTGPFWYRIYNLKGDEIDRGRLSTRLDEHYRITGQVNISKLNLQSGVYFLKISAPHSEHILKWTYLK